MVFIHGGGYLSGAGNYAMFQPTEWMNKYPEFIFVNFNYRLNSLGFLALDTANEDGIHGNFGLYDQKAALQWVYENVENFGGDSDQITLMGQSAGGQSAFVHTVWEESSQYFNKLIVDSGPVVTIPTGANDTDYYRFGSRFLQEVECRETARVWDCLRNVPEEVIRNATLGALPPNVGDGKGILQFDFKLYCMNQLRWLSTFLYGKCRPISDN